MGVGGAVRGVTAAVIFGLATPHPAAAHSADEFMATFVSPCVFGMDHGAPDLASSARTFGMQPVSDSTVIPDGSGRQIWRFPASGGPLYVSAPAEAPTDCAVTGYRIDAALVAQRMRRMFGEPVAVRTLADGAVEETYRSRSGGTATYTVWPEAKRTQPNAHAVYRPASGAGEAQQ